MNRMSGFLYLSHIDLILLFSSYKILNVCLVVIVCCG